MTEEERLADPQSHVCVLQTALDLLRAGISVYVLADAVSSCNKQEVPVAYDYIRHAGGVVTTSESIMFQLMRESRRSSALAPSSLVGSGWEGRSEADDQTTHLNLRSSLS